MKSKVKALVLFSGGLDSRLVVKLLQEQNIDIECLYFKLPFGCGCCNNLECNFNFSQMHNTKLKILDCTQGDLFNEYLEVVKHPKHGRGSSMNPCIDCKIFMFRKAEEYADKLGFRIIATGEVLGERPMSQTSKSLALIDKELGFEILRPLSAKLMKETQAEKEKLVDRTKFLDIQGRSRQVQLSLAKKYNITFPTPGGGCLLCEKAYKSRLQDLFNHNKTISPEQIQTLEGFRHFRSENNGKIIVGRNHNENKLLEEINKKLKYNLIKSSESSPGPTAIFEKEQDRNLAEDMIKVYSKKDSAERKKFDKIRV